MDYFIAIPAFLAGLFVALLLRRNGRMSTFSGQGKNGFLVQELLWPFLQIPGEPYLQELNLHTYRHERRCETSFAGAFLQAMLHEHSGQPQKAEKILRSLQSITGMSKAEREVFALHQLLCACLKGEWSEALKECERLPRRIRNAPPLQAVRGFLYDQMQDYPAALKIFRKLIRVHPEIAALRLKKCRILLRGAQSCLAGRNLRAAESLIEEILHENPQHGEALLARIDLALNRAAAGERLELERAEMGLRRYVDSRAQLKDGSGDKSNGFRERLERFQSLGGQWHGGETHVWR